MILREDTTFVKGMAVQAGFRRFYADKGYWHYTRFSRYLSSLLNITLATLLIGLGSPLFLILAMIIKVKDGSPVFYKSVRLGYKKKPFVMYKFRTLPQGTDKMVGGRLFSYKDKPIPAWARLMRETRLDELPQLFNILKRDMDFIGPRPVRPEVYEAQCKGIPNYDFRFEVRPGLIGYSQVFTPHSAPKRIRAFIDNALLRYKYSPSFQFYMIALAVYLSAKKFLMYSKKYCVEMISTVFTQKHRQPRRLDRVEPFNVTVWIRLLGGKESTVYRGTLVDANEKYIRIASKDTIETGSYRLELLVPSRHHRKKIVLLDASLWRTYNIGKKGADIPFHYVFEYAAASTFHQYLVDQYILSKSLFKWSDFRLR